MRSIISQKGIEIGLLVPIPGSDATDRHEKKNTGTPDVHGGPLCPDTQEWRQRVVVLKISRRRPDQREYCG